MTEWAVAIKKGTAARCKTNRSSQGVLVIWFVCVSLGLNDVLSKVQHS